MVELISASIGGVLGIVVVLLWQATERRLGSGAFWSSYQRIAANLLRGAEQEKFLEQYGELVRLLAGYLTKTAARAAITIAPVIVCLAVLAPLAARHAARSAYRLEVYPPQSVQLRIAQTSYSIGPQGSADLKPGELTGPLRVAANDRALELDEFGGAVAICKSAWTELGLQMIGLKTHRAPQGPDLLIVRASDGDRNFCWPYLSDEEFAFWAGMLASSLAAAVAGKVLSKVKRR